MENSKPHFTTANELLNWINILPPGPTWHAVQLEVQGYRTTLPIHIIWHDGLDIVRTLVGNPIFRQNMMFDPIKIHQNHEREFGAWFTGNEAFKIQVLLSSCTVAPLANSHTQDNLPEGTTIVPIIAASDKNPVTRYMGELEIHPLFLTIGNIDSDVYMKASAHAWHCVTFMPIPKFETHPDYQTITQTQVWHKCADLVTANLKHAAVHGNFMVDPFGQLWLSFTPLVAWTADLLEQLMIAYELQCIYDAAQTIDPWDLHQFQKHAKTKLLSGVHLPFWRDWHLSNPSVFLVPEVLHTLHKLFFDYILVWCKEVMGKDKLDFCFKVVHKCITMRQFSNGVSHVRQINGQEHRDIQCRIIAVLAGTTSPSFIAAICSLVDFIYQVQSPIHTDTFILSMQASLDEFHTLKKAITDAEARRGKSGCLHLGLHCKEKMQQFDLFTLMSEHGQSMINSVVAAKEHDEVTASDPVLVWIAQVSPEAETYYKAPHPVRNHFIKGILSTNTLTAIHLTVAPDHKRLSLQELSDVTCLLDFTVAITNYLASQTPDVATCLPDFRTVNVWSKFCVQLRPTFHTCVIMPSQVIQVYPPDNHFPYGNCDVMLLDTNHTAASYLYSIAQVHTVFKLHLTPYHFPAVLLIHIVWEKADCNVTSNMSQEYYHQFYFNHYADKEVYNALQGKLDFGYHNYLPDDAPAEFPVVA
ncbi:hypothetical protein BDN67DRAFT_983600 [Paxillus ammoniavirescens]|nr:hypothetical protein BDN67DRAFT_983600 [Paxillus ammoniavirescens]